MKIFILKHIVFIFALGSSIIVYGQDPLFSSYFENPLYYNPAAPGLISGNKFILQYREQWPGIPSSNRTYNYSSMHSFCGLFSLGIIANSNTEGESRLVTNNIGLAIAVPVAITKKTLLSAGITTTYGQKRIDWSKVEFDDQFDKLYGKVYNTQFPFPDNNSKNYGDLSIGLALKSILYKKHRLSLSGVIGAAINHVIVFPNPNFIGTDINAIPLKQDYFFELWLQRKNRQKAEGFAISTIYEIQGPMQTVNISLRYTINSIYILTGFRNKNYRISYNHYDSFILGFGYMFKERRAVNYIKVGYSYDFTISKLIGGAYGSHEIYIVYNLGKCNKLSGKKRKKYIPNRECTEMEFNPNGLFLHR